MKRKLIFAGCLLLPILIELAGMTIGFMMGLAR